MIHREGWPPLDLHIVSDRDLLLLQRSSESTCAGPGCTAKGRASRWFDGLDRVLDELERRDVVSAMAGEPMDPHP